MRFLLVLPLGLLAASLLTATGCNQSGQTIADEKRKAEPTTVEPSKDQVQVADELSPDLWTRKAGHDWPTFLGPTGDSKSTETGLVTPWPEKGPRIVWQKKLGTGYGIGSIAKGRLYQFDTYDTRADRGNARLTCMNAETGEEIWRFEYPSEYSDMLNYNNGPRASPVIDGNRVYIYGAEGMLHCLRATDGKLLWKVDTVEKYGVVQNFFGVGSTPAIAGDLLICMVGGSPPGSPGLYISNGAVDGNGSGIVAFNKFTGEVKYAITDELASYASAKIARIDDRLWGFMFCRGGLVGFEPLTGKVDFHYPWRATLLESVNASTPVVVGNEVLITETYQIGSSLLAVKPGGYDIVWKDERRSREKALMAHWNTPVYVDGYFYGSHGRHSELAELRCVEWKTGKVKWAEQTDSRSSLLYVDGHFICLGEFGTLDLIKVNPEKCEYVSKVILRDEESSLVDPIDGGQPRLLRYPCWSAPILSHGLLYVRGDDRLLCMEVIPQQGIDTKSQASE